MLSTALLTFASWLAMATAVPIVPSTHGASRWIESRTSKGCHLGGLSPPVAVSTPLPAPTDMRLVHIAIGRGTQNYTCGTNATAAPTPKGAKATLYAASCMAVKYPQDFAAAPAQAYNSSRTADPLGLPVSGQHYFEGPTQPVFDMTAVGLGVNQMAKNASAPAPTGTPPNVPWLYLLPVSTTGDISAIYRLNTKAGAAPATCAGKQGDFQVDYAAEYWFYKRVKNHKHANETADACSS